MYSLGGWIAVIAYDTACHQPMPDEQGDQRADRCGKEARTLIRPVPSNHLPDECGDKRTGNPKHGREDEAGGIIWSRRQQASNDTADEPNRDDPNDARHGARATYFP